MYRYIKKRKWSFIIFMLLTVISLSLSTYSAMLQQILIDHLVSFQNNIFWKDVLTLVLFTLVALVLNTVSKTAGASFSAKVAGDIRICVFDGLLRRNREQESKMETGDCVSALTNDISTIQNGYLNMLTMVVSFVVVIIVSTILMFIYQPLIAVTVIFAGLLMLVIPMKTGKIMAGMQKERSMRLAHLTSVLQELLGGFEIITSFGISALARKRFEQQNQTVVMQDGKTGCCKACIDGIAQLIGGISGMSIIAMSAFFVMRGQLSIGKMAVFSILQTNFSGSLQMLFTAFPVLKGSKPVIARLNELADISEEENGNKTAVFTDKIEIQNLHYTYNQDTEILKGANATFQKGRKYAVIGENGSGKTTFCRLLAGYSNHYTGKILYDKTELREFDSRSIPRMIAFLHQNVFLFRGSIRYNITLGEDFSEQSLKEALQLSGVEAFVNDLEDGLEHDVGENGNCLSGGQRQRIALARALIRKTPLLIMDEGTSALDEHISKEIEEQLMKLPELTLISITHDCSAEHLAIFDQVFRMKDGQICEEE